ncbi:hypothetical protein K2173_019722 [Erythroxylum novogranatense]|uniref:Uncharacterized protein n=1 Tax=Erythroxylum novogranatense TaxID=1862640 RepID=A0AAV8SMQ9_9ROSI|nr:hypothetical protein K2173_019722 [Erythroxylum novogranatense]
MRWKNQLAVDDFVVIGGACAATRIVHDAKMGLAEPTATLPLLLHCWSPSNCIQSRYHPVYLFNAGMNSLNSLQVWIERYHFWIVANPGSPKRLGRDGKALKKAKGSTNSSEVPSTLMPQEEYLTLVVEELHQFLQENFKPPLDINWIWAFVLGHFLFIF